MSKLKLSEFDLYGTFRLTKNETVGIKDLVQKIGHNEYLSRNANYYPTNWYGENGSSWIFDEYERLNELLPMSGKPAFVICEKMHQLAVCATNTIQQELQIHLSQNGEHFDTVAQKCAQECADNLVRLMNGQIAEKTVTKLRDETWIRSYSFCDCRTIQADNKKQLYMCANALPDDVEHLITPGRGSSKLGTLVQAIRKQKGLKPLGITQIHYSLYGDMLRNSAVFTKPLKNLPEKLLVMDDDIDTGRTLTRIKQELTQQGHQVTSGAIISPFDSRFFSTAHWAKDIDIIPNQYGRCTDQPAIHSVLESCRMRGTGKITKLFCRERTDDLTRLLNNPRNGDKHHTADYLAMRMAEEKVHELGADLYQESAKISAAAVDYNKKFRAQVEAYDRQS